MKPLDFLYDFWRTYCEAAAGDDADFWKTYFEPHDGNKFQPDTDSLEEWAYHDFMTKQEVPHYEPHKTFEEPPSVLADKIKRPWLRREEENVFVDTKNTRYAYHSDPR